MKKFFILYLFFQICIGNKKDSYVDQIKFKPPKYHKLKAKPRPIIVNPIIVKPAIRMNRFSIQKEGGQEIRKLANMNPDYPYTPYGFYSPPDKYTEMPYQITNYTGDIPHVKDTTPEKDLLKQKVKDQTQFYEEFGNAFELLKEQMEKVQNEYEQLRSYEDTKILEMDGKINQLRTLNQQLVQKQLIYNYEQIIRYERIRQIIQELFQIFRKRRFKS